MVARSTVVEFEGHNGEMFCLAGPKAGNRGVVLGSDIDDFYDAPFVTMYKSWAFQNGADFQGKKFPERRTVFSVEIAGSLGGPDWQDNDSEWAKAWSAEKDCKLWIETKNSRRYLKIRLAKELKIAAKSDPNQTQVDTIIVTCVSGDPFWYEEMVSKVWPAPSDTTNGSTVTGNIWRREDGSFAEDEWLNPTDIPIFPIWQIQAPGKPTLPDYSFGSDYYSTRTFDAAVGHASRQIVMPTMLAGENVYVNTDSASKGGQFRSSIDTAYYMRMKMVRFLYGIPPYTPARQMNVAMSLAPAGVGINLRLPRPWTRPWGLQ